MNKEIYLIELSNLTPHLETTFEITIKHLENNDKVNYYFLGHETIYKEGVFPLKFSYLYPKKFLPEEKAAQLIKNDNFHFNSKYKLQKDKKTNFNFSNIEELKSIEYENFDIGMAVVSSLISLKKDSNPSILTNRKLINKMLLSSLQVYQNTLSLLKNKKVDLVILNEDGEKIDGVILSKGEDDYELLIELHTLAKQSYYKIDETFKSIFEELDSNKVIGEKKKHELDDLI